MSSPSYPAAKRRRLETANSALKKPFRSPLKTSVASAALSPVAAATGASTGIPRCEEIGSGDTEIQGLVESTSTPPPPTVAPARILSSRRVSPTKKMVPTPSTTTESPEVQALHTEYSSLLNQLTTVKSQLDTANHALRIETKGQDQELRALITKWKSASREAAALVFEAARVKVEKMGGIRAWRERERESRGGGGGMGQSWGWDDGQGRGEGFDEEDDGRRDEMEDVGKEEDDDDDDVSVLTPAVMGVPCG